MLGLLLIIAVILILGLFSLYVLTILARKVFEILSDMFRNR